MWLPAIQFKHTQSSTISFSLRQISIDDVSTFYEFRLPTFLIFKHSTLLFFALIHKYASVFHQFSAFYFKKVFNVLSTFWLIKYLCNRVETQDSLERRKIISSLCHLFLIFSTCHNTMN